MKKIISIITCAVMAFAAGLQILPVSAESSTLASYKIVKNTVSEERTDTTLYINGTGYIDTIKIPKDSSIKKVILSEGITGCKNLLLFNTTSYLEDIYFPESFTQIDSDCRFEFSVSNSSTRRLNIHAYEKTNQLFEDNNEIIIRPFSVYIRFENLADDFDYDSIYSSRYDKSKEVTADDNSYTYNKTSETITVDKREDTLYIFGSGLIDISLIPKNIASVVIQDGITGISSMNIRLLTSGQKNIYLPKTFCHNGADDEEYLPLYAFFKPRTTVVYAYESAIEDVGELGLYNWSYATLEDDFNYDSLFDGVTETKIKGDLYSDGYIDVRDVMIINQYINGTRDLSETEKELADCNGDGEITNEDAELILNYIIGNLDKI